MSIGSPDTVSTHATKACGVPLLSKPTAGGVKRDLSISSPMCQGLNCSGFKSAAGLKSAKNKSADHTMISMMHKTYLRRKPSSFHLVLTAITVFYFRMQVSNAVEITLPVGATSWDKVNFTRFPNDPADAKGSGSFWRFIDSKGEVLVIRYFREAYPHKELPRKEYYCKKKTKKHVLPAQRDECKK